MEKQQTLTVEFSLEILQEKIRTFQQKQREWIQCIKGLTPIQVPQESGLGLRMNINDQTELINYKFQLMYNRIKRLMDVQSLIIERMMIDSSTKGHQYGLASQTARGENYELYQLLNDSNKTVANLQSLNNHSKAKIKQLQSQIKRMIGQIGQQRRSIKQKVDVLMDWQLKQRTWVVEKQLLIQNTEDLKRKISQQQQYLDGCKSKIVRSEVQKQNMLSEIESLNKNIKEEAMRRQALQKDISTKIHQMKTQLREQIKSQIQSQQVHDTVSLKLLRKMATKIQIKI